MKQERIDAKVVKGGRNFRFTALVVVGDGKGHVGAGLGKAAEIPEAIRKGKEDAMKRMITVALDANESITHDVIGKFGSSSVLLKNAPDGTGVIAGGPARAVIEMAGIKNIRTKSLGSNTSVQNHLDPTISRMLYLLRSKVLEILRHLMKLQDFAANQLKRSWANMTGHCCPAA